MSLNQAAALAELPARRVLLVEGEQALDLLQAQLTQDVRQWPEDTARLAALCNPQGRMLADFLLWREPDGRIAMELDASLAEAALKRLRLFILRLRCRIDDAGAQRKVFGLLEPAPQDETDVPDAAAWRVEQDDALTRIRLPAAPGLRRTLVVARGDAGLDAAGALQRTMAPADAQAWELAAVRAGIPRLSAPTAQQFVPQMLNFELLGAVNFHKGCYPGQEVVARTQYRGGIKRRTYRVTGAQPMAAGDEVFDATDPGQPCGMVVNAAHGPQGWEALAELKIASADSDAALHLGSADGPLLQRATLPYGLSPALD